jgi:hypothetical protein
MSKTVTIVLILIITTTSLLIMAKSAWAQPTPSVPEFTLKFIDNSYTIPSFYGPDPYTGKNVTIAEGAYVKDQYIEVTIKNQPFTSYIDENGSIAMLYYNIRFKDHLGSWTMGSWTLSEYENKTGGYFPASNSESTQVLFSLGGDNGSGSYYHETYMLVTQSDGGINWVPLSGGQIDCQVEAFAGHSITVYGTPQVVVMPNPKESGAVSPQLVNVPNNLHIGESSGWTNTQTITRPNVSPEVSPSPSPEPNSEIINPYIFLIPILIAVVAVIAALVYFKTHKKQK